jgi:hypothetical protein
MEHRLKIEVSLKAYIKHKKNIWKSW